MVKRIGDYVLGTRRVEVYVDPSSSGGSFDSTTFASARIIVGLNKKNWPDVVNILLHETVELACSDLGVRFNPVPDYADSSDGFVFVMDHSKFSEAMGRAAWLISECLPELADEFRKKEKKCLRKSR